MYYNVTLQRGGEKQTPDQKIIDGLKGDDTWTMTVITDGGLSPVYRTAAPVEAAREQLRQALAGPVYLTEDLRLSGRGLL